MTPDEPNQLGALWSMYSLSSKDLSLEWKFRIGGYGSIVCTQVPYSYV